MYLEHFGLTEPPFKITPVTEFFFSGANRGEILDALIYAITDGEGIIKISGEVGSGKTMLCRMLLDRLPTNIKAIYLANPSLSRDELLYAIADGLGLELEGQRVSVLLQNLHNHLVEKHHQGERCVVLVDEAHAMPVETLEELRLLYNLQVGKDKLIQIVLFGQPELDSKLAQTNMRQLKDRIVHHFNMQPLSKKVIESYLMFRMRAAGYHGPDIFSPSAIALIGKASNGLLRRVNILADKSLLAAFVENTHNIDTRHVQAAIRDSELTPNESWLNRKNAAIVGGIALLAFAIAGAGWLLGRADNRNNATDGSAPVMAMQTVTAASSVPTPASSAPRIASVEFAPTPALATTNVTQTRTPEKHSAAPLGSLLHQRLSATEVMLAQGIKGRASLQLFYTEDVRPARMEGFLSRAKNLGKLSEIYVLSLHENGKEGFRVLYGIYPDSTAARAAAEHLPQRYKDAFSPGVYELDDFHG
jgi:type II secretory pathway predicted ATPase ExeA